MEVDEKQLAAVVADAVSGFLEGQRYRNGEPSEPPKRIPEDLATLKVDWDVLRLLVGAKLAHEHKSTVHNDEGFKPLSRKLDISDSTLRKFMRGKGGSNMPATVFLRLVAYVGYTNLLDFTKEEEYDPDGL